MFDTTFQSMAKMDRPPCYYRALFQCLSLMDPIQFRRISAREIAEASGLSFASAQRAMSMLQADRAIIGKGKASSRAYRLNNRLCSMSSSERWNQETPDLEMIDSRGR